MKRMDTKIRVYKAENPEKWIPIAFLTLIIMAALPILAVALF